MSIGTGNWTITAVYNTSLFGGGATIAGIRGWPDDAPYFVRDANGQNDLISSRDGRVMEENWIGSPYIATVASATFTPDAIQYDCINGACVAKTTYNTPGIYESLEACEVACGTGCSGQCISNSDWSQIENLAVQIKSRNCN